jgi:hypothetical protein
MGIVAAAILFTALTACSIGPGLLLLPWMHVDDDEKSVVVVGVSLLSVFLAAFGIYLARLPVGCGWAVTAACVACIGFRWSTLLRLLAHPVVRVQLAGLALVLGHSLLLQASIRNYNGLFWVGDWYEHFERTVFFIEKPDPVAARFLSDIWGPSASYMLTARPPFMNVLTAHAIAHGTPSFAAFQLASTWLNALACLPAMAIASRCATRFQLSPERGSLAVAAAITLLPSFAENVTFTWTKQLAAFYVLAAVLLVERRDAIASPGRLAVAGTLLGAGVAVHYSSAVYAVVLGSAVVVMAFFDDLPGVRSGWLGRVTRSCIAALAFGLPQVIVLLPWLGFSWATFGLRETLAANTAVADAAGMTPTENLWKMALNCFDTLVPHFLREQPPLIAKLMAQPNPSAALRDWWFAPLQVNFPMAVGTVTQVVATGIAVWLLASSLAERESKNRVVLWAWLVVAGFLLGVAVHGARDTIGLAHICLQPLILIAAGASAAALPRIPRLIRVLALAGLAWDYLVGVMLQFWLEHLPVDLFAIALPDSSRPVGNRFGIEGAAIVNATIKQAHQLTFLGDAWPEACPRLWACAVLVGLAAWVSLVVYAFRPEATRGGRVFMHRFFAW